MKTTFFRQLNTTKQIKINKKKSTKENNASNGLLTGKYELTFEFVIYFRFVTIKVTDLFVVIQIQLQNFHTFNLLISLKKISFNNFQKNCTLHYHNWHCIYG